MANLREPEIIEKWAHIAMKLFPPQMDITPTRRSGGWAICARWKAAEDSASPARKNAKGVDLFFPERALAEYSGAAAEDQLRWDAFIESWIKQNIQRLGPAEDAGADQTVDLWLIPWDSATAR